MNYKEKVKVYGAPWCPDCRRAKQFLGEQRVLYEWIDVDQDPDALRYIEKINNGKQTIPTILFGDGSILVEPTNAELAQKLDIQPKAKRTYYDLIIIGGGPAGLTAGVYASREGIDTLIIERAGIGGQAGVTQLIENYPGFPKGIEGGSLADRFKEHAEHFGVEILPAQSVNKISYNETYKIVVTETGDEYCSRALILATGTRYKRLGVPGEEDLIGAGIHFCATCDAPFYKGKEMIVVGGGNSGIEEGLFITKFASKVTVLEVMDRLGASKILREKASRHPNMEIRLNTTVQEFKGNGKLRSVVVKDLKSGKLEELTPGAVFIFIGLDPNTEILKGLIDLDKVGFIKTSLTMETNVPGIFAAGDVRAGSTKQVASAVGEGTTAALMIRHYLESEVRGRGYKGD